MFSTASPRRLHILYFETLIPYPTAWELQRSLFEARRADPQLEDVLLLLEHPPVYTLGRGADAKFLQFNPQCSEREVYRIERGGEVTYHCPGQLVGYPILNLKRHQPDLHDYLRRLEGSLIAALGHLGLAGERLPGLTGVWLEGAKVAAIGIQVSRWITRHGFALNVCPDLQGFREIVPCGIGDRPVGSLQHWLPQITVSQVVPAVIEAFSETFELEPQLYSIPGPISETLWQQLVSPGNRDYESLTMND
ncbi:lipoyl(octanoyl) transferase LipB [Sodalinema gerasimenkoae]|uniref:lipoyl(octanoyl) transferase LipB n=1 Tax=Sodalinema gerasimenkoae TaxID=2862348 RepID=UPI00135B98A2|nr:lipoyl(octanoyl) transferase LipB [Sodalinema gerasimenkoae]